MKKDKYYLNRERFESEMKRHEGGTHSRIKYKGHYAKLDKEVDIAYIIGVSRSTLSNYKTNKESIPIDNLQALGRLFKCDWEYLCGEQDYRTSPEGLMAALNETQESARRAKEDNKPWFECAISSGEIESMTITCNKYPVRQLIFDIARFGGYTEILEGLKLLSEDIAAANVERNKPLSF